MGSAAREGSLSQPTRHPIAWREPEYFDEDKLVHELERVYDLCHGCRRCFSLCNSFPLLFDAIDASPSGELDGVDKKVFWEVADHCYLCDMCYLSKCPYVPPHPWNIDFPHLMLRAKAVKFRQGGTRTRDKILSSTDMVGTLAGIPVVSQIVNKVNSTAFGRRMLDRTLGVHPEAPIPDYHSTSGRTRVARGHQPDAIVVKSTAETRGKVALFATCYCNRNEPDIDDDLATVFRHNGIPVTVVPQEKCCGMPKLELGDLESIQRAKAVNVPALAAMVEQGYDLVAPIPSCALMFKQELPLLFPEDEQVQKVRAAMFDPFEYLALRHKAGLLRTDFAKPLGKVSYHVPCHLRVQNLGLKTRDVLQLIPGTEIEPIERCSGHNGTYGVKKEYRETSMKIGKPVFSKVRNAAPDYYASDCPMAGHQIESGLGADPKPPTHPLKLLRIAYGL
ncbi:MAG: heterodisulfide reductase-related iron-sulfur binding cluster [Proteobacteria bacterium]|nr:heterodisulfide reductase-related iron-sulfur binding cluster [Pseudomonadota bacterium]